MENLFLNKSFDFKDINLKFDYLVCVFLSPTFELLAVIHVSYKVVKELGTQIKTSFRFRWNKQTAKDPQIEWLYQKSNQKIN